MSLRFILGRAGTGKTRLCLKEIQNLLREDPLAGALLIFLVPEQASFQMETALTGSPGVSGMIRAQVLSFRRLGWLVFQEAGGTNRRYLDDLGKLMSLRSLVLKKGGELKLFNQTAREPGFIQKLNHTLKEFKIYNVAPEKLQEQYERLTGAEQQDPVLGLKLHDLYLIYREYENFLQGRYTDPDDYLNLLAEKIRLSPTMKKAVVWVDGFAGFTPQEMKVMESLLTTCRQVTLALCLDSQNLSAAARETDLFRSARETYDKFLDLTASLKVPVGAPVELDVPGTLPPRFLRNPILGILEKNYEKPGRHPAVEIEGLKLIAAANRRAEVEGVAREIIRLARDKGYRYRELAVILRDLDHYAELVATIFQDYRIPFFMDQKRPVDYHPLIELVRAALEVANSFWGYDPLFRYLKTDLVPVTRSEVDLLENYVLAYGIRGVKWMQKEPWAYYRHYTLEEDREPSAKSRLYLRRVNETRHKAVKELGKFYRLVTGAKQLEVAKITSALYQLLQDLKAAKRLNSWRSKAEQTGDLETAEEHTQVWNGLMELFDQLVNALGQQKMTLQEYAEILDAGLETLRLGLIPPALDQVLVGSVERSRQPEIKAAFVLGLNDGVFPARIREDEIFSDREREELVECNLKLAPTSKFQLFDEQYLAYIALTRASEYLWVSYSLADEEGKTLLPSVIVGHLLDALPGLAARYLALEPQTGDLGSLDFIVKPRQTLSQVARKLQQARKEQVLEPLWLEAYRWLVMHQEHCPEAKDILPGLNYRNGSEPLKGELVEKLYGSPFRASVSRLETFAACPFRYFAEYGLGLKEREIFQLDAPGLGVFYHQALKNFVDKLDTQGWEWGQLTDEKTGEMVEHVVADLAPQLQNEILLSSARYRYLTLILKRTLLTAVKILTEHARRGKFRPAAVELGFGPSDAVPAFKIDLGAGRLMELRGRIDRVDLAEEGDTTYLRVIDYKSSSKDLKLIEAYYGLSIQLLTYLDIALESGSKFGKTELEPGGALYFPVINPLIKAAGPLETEKIEAEIRKKLKMKGLVLADLQLARLMGAEKGTSDLVPFVINKDESLGKKSKSISKENWQLLRKFMRYRLAELGRDIYRGTTKITPYRLGTNTPCTYCPIKPACQFDVLIEGSSYRQLSAQAEENLWAGMKSQITGGGHNDCC